MTRDIVTGIDIGTYTTRVVIAQRVRGRVFPRIIGTGKAESHGLRRGYIINQADAVKSIREAVTAAEKNAGMRIKNAYISVGGVSLESTASTGEIIASRADGKITQMDVDNAIAASEDRVTDLKNKKVIESIPIKYKLDGKEVPGRVEGMKGTKLEVKTLFITCLEQHLEDLVQAVEDTGVEVEHVIPAPVAASLIALTKRQRMMGALLANIGAETVSMVVYEDDVPISLCVLPIGSTDITNDIALGFRIPLDEAERVKTGEQTQGYPRKKLEEIIDARLSDIFDLIEAHLQKIGRSGLLPAGITITGGGAGISTIEDLARATLRLPSNIPAFKNNQQGQKNTSARKPQSATQQQNGASGSAPADANTRATLASEQKGLIRDSSWYVAYGLCVSAINQEGGGNMRGRAGSMQGYMKKVGEWLKQLLP